ncbi:MAG: diguanylate cyclase [Sulfuricurvum sp.]|uniref:diguanylate cyclase n=1 Tax=Sulfuricurvum sp. TaxID=2025608 RepID=UPI0027332010|nr:diguanylate cyclase [Sulfuricurvum sp.]MDP2851703.1 diguanylate cyclase [Sulfuricurvum sp.]
MLKKFIKCCRRNFFFQITVLFLPIAIGIIGIALYSYDVEKKREFTLNASNQFAILNMGKNSIRQALERVKYDVQYLSHYHEFEDYIITGSSEKVKDLSHDFKFVMENRRVYDQIRWIDETGMERFRINFNNGSPVLIDSQYLQNKKGRYYFSDAMRYREGETYFSLFDLNVENEKIETPYKPTIRSATPIIDKDGHKKGIFIINYLGDELIHKFIDATSLSHGDVMLLNDKGYWLKGVKKSDEWGFMFNRKDLSLAERNPSAWQRISKEEEGEFVDEKGLWTFMTIHPPANVKEGSEGSVWKAVILLPAAKLYSKSDTLFSHLSVFVVLGLIAAGIGSFTLAYLYRKKQLILKELSELHQRTEGILRSVPDMIMQVDNDKRYIWANHVGTEFFGEEVIGKEASFYFEGEQNTYTMVQPLFTGENHAVYVESWQRRYDGEKRLLAWWCQTLRDEEGIITGILSTARDITDEYEIQKNLQESEKKYKTLVENSMVGIYRSDTLGNILYVNSALAKILSFDSSDDLIEGKSVLRYKNPEERAIFIEKLYKARYLNNYEMELLDKYDVPIPVMVSATLEENVLSGMIIDMREIKESRKEIEKLSKAVEQVDDIVYITDKVGNISYVNEAYSRHTGYTREDAIGNNSRISKSGMHDREFYKELWTTILNGEVYRNTLINRKKNGDLYYEKKTITPLKDDNHHIVGFISTGKDVTQETMLHQEVERIATIDSLTGIYNRHKFEELFILESERSRRFGHPLSMIMIDIDHFKSVNDTYGHNVGDEVLKHLANVAQENIRKIDIFARWGGEEFLILSPDTDLENIRKLAEKLRMAVEKAVFPTIGHITISLGVSTLGKDDSFSELFKRADHGLYYAKEHGRNQVGMFT